MTEDTFRYANAITSRKSVYLKDADKYEEELATSQADSGNADTQDNENPDSPKDKGSEHNWEKRFSDLQSYMDKKINSVKESKDSEIAELQKELKEAKNKPKQYPVSDDEISAWAAQFPDFHKTLMTIVEKMSDSKAAEIRQEIRGLEQQSQAIAAEKGRQELLKLHPDAFDIEKSSQFKVWFDTAKPRVRALIESPDPFEIAEGLRLFKENAGIRTISKTNSDREASRSVAPSQADIPQGKKTWKESEVDKMHPKTFAKYEAEIDKARKEGRFDYDLSSI